MLLPLRSPIKSHVQFLFLQSMFPAKHVDIFSPDGVKDFDVLIFSLKYEDRNRHFFFHMVFCPSTRIPFDGLMKFIIA